MDWTGGYSPAYGTWGGRGGRGVGGWVGEKTVALKGRGYRGQGLQIVGGEVRSRRDGQGKRTGFETVGPLWLG